MVDRSSVSVSRYDVGDMVRVDHFTGCLLLSRFEARHLLTLLDHELENDEPMTLTEARAIVEAQKALVREYT